MIPRFNPSFSPITIPNDPDASLEALQANPMIMGLAQRLFVALILTIMLFVFHLATYGREKSFEGDTPVCFLVVCLVIQAALVFTFMHIFIASNSPLLPTMGWASLATIVLTTITVQAATDQLQYEDLTNTLVMSCIVLMEWIYGICMLLWVMQSASAVIFGDNMLPLRKIPVNQV